MYTDAHSTQSLSRSGIALADLFCPCPHRIRRLLLADHLLARGDMLFRHVTVVERRAAERSQPTVLEVTFDLAELPPLVTVFALRPQALFLPARAGVLRTQTSCGAWLLPNEGKEHNAPTVCEDGHAELELLPVRTNAAGSREGELHFELAVWQLNSLIPLEKEENRAISSVVFAGQT